MAKPLARYVHVRNPEGGDMTVFGPGEYPPEWARGLITNPKAWGEDTSPTAEELYAAQTGAPPPDTDTAEGPAGAASKPARRAGRQTLPPRA
jgi:hypothetical protein